MGDPLDSYQVSLPGGIKIVKGTMRKCAPKINEIVRRGESTTVFVRRTWDMRLVSLAVVDASTVSVQDDGEQWVEDLTRALTAYGITPIKGGTKQ